MKAGLRWVPIGFLLLLACGSERPPFDPENPELDTRIDPGAGRFRIAVAAPEGGEAVVLVGEDLVIDRERGMVAFRAALENPSAEPLYAPIRLVLTHLDPPAIASLDPDGFTESGDPYYDWTAEAGSDMVLAPGETTARARMSFSNPDEKAFSLGALLESNLGPTHNAIGGSVFLDRRPNGRRDREETGLQGIHLELVAGERTVAETVTDAGGHYVFLGLEPGLHAVRAAVRDLATATPNPLHVALVPTGDSEASSFLTADFACYRRAEPGSTPAPLVGPIRALARGETVTESFELAMLPERPLVLLAELRGDEATGLAEAELMLNGHPLVAAADFPTGLRLVRREVLPDLLKPGANTLEVRAVARGDQDLFLVVTMR
ncbi:MAG TPA: SdrD B-like domain-containing protein [Candidatus Udaeobacter sp.]|nr:SdrD B-like domain-containing protein [Candidatus Udaeobacter sp.]